MPTSLQTAWVKPPRPIGGLDHIGTQAPCIQQYGQLLPGITNVTDRARYYSLYPWIIWSIEKRYPKCSKDVFLEKLRCADFLLTLVAEAHSQIVQDGVSHSQGMTGGRQVNAAWERLGRDGQISLSDFTARAASPLRYFQNPRGGLGQYYLGVLIDLGLLSMQDVKVPFVGYTKEQGRLLAEAVDAGAPSDNFWHVVDRGTVDLDGLDALSPLCMCAISKNPSEEQLLDQLFRAEGAWSRDASRRRTIALLLDYAAESAAEDIGPWTFREGAYTAMHVGREVPWAPPSSLIGVQGAWARYDRNEILSVLFQAVHSWALWQVQNYPGRIRGAGSLAELAELLGREMDRFLPDQSFVERQSAMRADVPKVQDRGSEVHELRIAEGMTSGETGWQDSEAVARVVDALALLRNRLEDLGEIYPGGEVVPVAFRNYPIHLGSFWVRSEAWRAQPLKSVFREMVLWVLQSHFLVALRKLRQTGESTFHLVQGEQGFEVVKGVPIPTWTNPRLRQTIQILRDLGVLARAENEPALTAKGARWRMELAGG